MQKWGVLEWFPSLDSAIIVTHDTCLTSDPAGVEVMVRGSRVYLTHRKTMYLQAQVIDNLELGQGSISLVPLLLQYTQYLYCEAYLSSSSLIINLQDQRMKQHGT